MSLNVLLPLDGSPRAGRMIGEAIRMAKIVGKEFTFFLMQVMEITPLLPRAQEAEGRILKERGLEYLSTARKKVEKEGIKTELVIKDGNPAIEICDYAERNNIDLVIMASHGFGGALRWALGSVTDKVVRHCSIPVLVIKVPKKMK